VRTFFVNIYWHPDPTGTGKLLHELARDLRASGRSVAAITSVPHYGSREERSEGSGLIRTQDVDGVELRRTSVWVPKKVTLLSRLVNYFSFSALVIPAGLRGARPDVVVATWPLLAGIPAWLLARLRGARFVLNVQDVIPHGLLKNPIAAFGHFTVEKLLLKLADRVVVLSQPMADLLEERGCARRKLRIAPNWIDVDEIRPRVRDEGMRHRLGVGEEDFLILSSGNIGQLGGLDCVLDAMALVKDEPRIKLVVCGHGNARARLEQRARNEGLSSVIFRDTEPRDRFPALLAAADLCLVARDGRFAGHNVPSRAYSFLAAGRPLLAVLHPMNETSRVATVEGCGWHAPQDDPEALARRLREIVACPPQELARRGATGRAFVEREHARPVLTARWAGILEEAAEA
jgi:colanic acid biosynthesis glycosyl transferase WcaI